MGVKIINPPEIIIEITDLAGQSHKLTGRRITRKNVKEFNKIFGEETAKKTVEDQLPYQMAWVFGGRTEDYFEYDTRALKLAVQYYASEIQNPT
jgi:hypothetical protein